MFKTFLFVWLIFWGTVFAFEWQRTAIKEIKEKYDALEKQFKEYKEKTAPLDRE